MVKPIARAAPLHPERIREALRLLGGERVRPDPEAFDRVNETAIAAIELVRKGQLALGLTANVVDDARDGYQAFQTLLRIVDNS